MYPIPVLETEFGRGFRMQLRQGFRRKFAETCNVAMAGVEVKRVLAAGEHQGIFSGQFRFAEWSQLRLGEDRQRIDAHLLQRFGKQIHFTGTSSETSGFVLAVMLFDTIQSQGLQLIEVQTGRCQNRIQGSRLILPEILAESHTPGN